MEGGTQLEGEALEAEFWRLVEIIENSMDKVDKFSVDFRLDLYANGKQAREGDCNTKKPGLLDIKGRYKWDAWNKKKGADRAECMRKFIKLAKEVLGEQ